MANYGNRHSDNRRKGVPLSDLDPAITETSRKVIGCAIEVHRTLGPGYSRDVYANAVKMELQGEGINFKEQHAFDVTYKDKVVGETVADLFIEGRFAIEVLAFNGEVGSAERSHLRSVLRAGGLQLGLIINFGERRLKDGLVRVLNPDKIESLQNRDDDHDHDHDGDEDDGA